MTRFRFLLFFILICLQGVSVPAFSSSPSLEHIFIVVLENTNAEDAYSQPFMRMIASQGAYLANFHGVTHPSQPNYLALTSGSTWNVDNKNVTIDASNIGDLLETRGKSWKVYAEGYPGKCFLDEKRGPYARKHVPFLSYRNIQANPSRCAKVVNSSELLTDIKNGALPNFALYIPDNNNNGHDTGVAYADNWLKKTFENLLKDRQFTRHLLFIVVFDEGGSHNDDNLVYVALWGEPVSPGSVSNIRYDHYSLLRSVEDIFKLGTLGRNDQKGNPITGIWRKNNLHP